MTHNESGADLSVIAVRLHFAPSLLIIVICRHTECTVGSVVLVSTLIACTDHSMLL